MSQDIIYKHLHCEGGTDKAKYHYLVFVVP